MELFLLKDEFSYLKPVLSRTADREESVDLVVSDSMPDVDSIQSVSVVPMLREKEAFAGKAVISGVCDVAVYYESGEADKPQLVRTTFEFSESFDCQDVSPDSLLTASVTAVNADARAVNSRKVAVKIELRYDAGAYNKTTLAIPYGTAGSDTVEVLNGTKTLRFVCGAAEKVFSITDSVHVPALSDISVGEAEFSVEEVKIVDTKAVVKGSAFTTLIIDGDEKKVESPFSQVVDLAVDKEPKEVRCFLMATGVYAAEKADPDSRDSEAEIELSLVCQCVSYGETEVKYLADAYSTKGEVTLGCEEAVFANADGEEETLRFISSIEEGEPLDAPEKHSLTLFRLTENESVWAVAKRYSASREKLRAANGLESDQIEAGSLILIPNC